MAKVEGVEKLQSQLKKLQRDIPGRVSVAVGYTQNYALFVHENLEAFHKVGQAKFLEQPFRELAPELGTLIRQAVQQGSTLAQALVIAGLRLQRESQELCPVDTGALKNSAFTRLEQ